MVYFNQKKKKKKHIKCQHESQLNRLRFVEAHINVAVCFKVAAAITSISISNFQIVNVSESFHVSLSLCV